MPLPPPWRPPSPLPASVQTPRLLLRFHRPEDAPALHRAVAEDRACLLPWLPWAATGHGTVEDSLQTIDHFARSRSFAEATDFALGIFDRASGEVLGGTGLHAVRPRTAEAEIGYWVRGSHRRRGVATEAVRALVSAAFTAWGLRRVVGVCAGGNVASRAVAERVGFRREAVEVSARWVEGLGWQDTWRYALLATEWDAADGRRHGAPDGRAARPKGFGATDPRIPPYVEALLEPEDPVLAEIRARSAAAGLPPIAVGPFDGRHLEVLARAAGARRVIEVGTLGGYSGTCLARALPPDGVLHTFEIDPRSAEVAAESFRRAGVAERVRIHVGPALERLPEIEAEGPFDLVFVDADKAAYPRYLAWATDHLRPGGLLLADNVFRRAAVPVEGEPPGPAEGIRAFNEALARSGRFRATMLPLEDGLAVGVRLPAEAVVKARGTGGRSRRRSGG